MEKLEKVKKVEHLKKKAEKVKKEIDYYNALQLALKLVLNGSYGAFATKYFILYNNMVAGTITAEGRELTRTMDTDNEDYWYNKWHLDTDIHKKLCINNVSEIPDNEKVSIYGDSVDGDSIIETPIGKFKIEDLYNQQNEKSIRKDKEVIPAYFDALNWTKDKGVYFSKVKNIIRHKTTKKKWKIKSGDKEIIVTGDHSLIVFRNNHKLEIKAKDLKKGDKVLIVNSKSDLIYNYKFTEIDSVEEIGNFKNEYVYDLEMEDESHTFIANDILVHNTDSIFVSFKPAMDHSDWKNQIFNNDYLSKIEEPFVILGKEDFKVGNENHIKTVTKVSDLEKYSDIGLILIDGSYVKDKKLNKLIDGDKITTNLRWNWSDEVEFIQGVDKMKYHNYFEEMLDKHAASYGVENKEVFELERISESIINIAKKKYIQHILHEDGIDFEKLNYIFPKGVELVRSSTPPFAREKIINIVKYLFSHPDSFNIKDLLKKVRDLRKEFELADIDDIAMQSSVSNYENKVIDDKNLPIKYATGAHFAVKATAYYNYLLNKDKSAQLRYEFIKSGTKIKYYVCKDKKINKMFAYKRGSYPIEFAPEIDYDTQFEKSILSPINSIIEPLGMPEITKRLGVVMDIFGGM